MPFWPWLHELWHLITGYEDWVPGGVEAYFP